ncbi:glycoside hydrolase family 43 protein [Actinopolymorpha sp. B9G3]|uniref:glycoside hydrolase family 43 protein n=1 Tax=Actinopolymorpha sp. B9G3 TaxID=3158970 RepID=UPI0032D98E7A
MALGTRPHHHYRTRGALRAAVLLGVVTLLPPTAVAASAMTSDPVADRQAGTPSTSFRPGAEWRDTDGKVIQAHGGQVLQAVDDDGKRIWYWYGEDRSNGYFDSPGIHLYSSHDLYNWKDNGLALRTLSSQDQFTNDKYFAHLYKDYTAEQREIVWRDLSTNLERTDGWARPSILERPKVIYNKATGKWVMWVHSDGPSSPTSTSTYARAEAGVAIANSPKGPFRWLGSYRLNHVPSDSVPWCGSSPAFDPAGGMARDMTLFVDDDGIGYIIYSSEENRTMYISKLNAAYTYLSAPPETAVQGKDFVRTLACNQREAPAMFKSEGRYYLVTSGATGWDPNPARYATATEILGTWTDRGNPISGPGAGDTYRSQSTNVIPYDRQQNKFIFMGDRWTPSTLATSPYVWMPMSFGENGTLTIGPDAEWQLDDLQPYQHWTVTTPMPDHVWLRDTSTLPTQVQVSQAGVTTTHPVSWDPSTVAQPGPTKLRGTLDDGRTFTRDVVVVPHGLRYVVNAGGAATADWQLLADAGSSEAGLLNSTPEQPVGADPGTGTTWGYTGSSGTYGGAAGDLYNTLRWAKDKEPLTYTFTGLDRGTYTVHAGYWDPWPWANRAAQVSINGTVVDEERLFTSDYTTGEYANISVGDDGEIVVDIAPTRAPDIQVSWLMVTRTD